MTSFHPPLRHVAGEDLDAGTAQTDGMARWAAISGARVGSEAIWMGRTHVPGGVHSADHHHGESETAIFVVSGTPEFVFLDGSGERRLQTKPGDFVFVPPFTPHREENNGSDEAVVVIARSTQEPIVVNLPSLHDGTWDHNPSTS